MHVTVVFPREMLEDIIVCYEKLLENPALSSLDSSVLSQAYTIKEKLKRMGKQTVKLSLDESTLFVIATYQYLKSQLPQKYVI